MKRGLLFRRLLLVTFCTTAFADDALLFDRDVRPILSDRCYACHGPDEYSRKAKLRLDQRDSALGGNERGAAIVPGKPELSELVARITTEDPDDLMPHLATVADELTIIRSMKTTTNVHHPGVNMMNCGSVMFGRPTLGAWLSYGLGSENSNLPNYIALTSGALKG